jgi:hypothetical protein
MDIETLTRFFMWCTIINGGLFIVWSVFLLLLPDVTYRLQHGFVPIPRETYNVVIYAFLGLFKILFLIFNLAPYLALLILA